MELKKIGKMGAFFSFDALVAVSIIFLFLLVFYPYLRDSKVDTSLQYDVIKTLSALKVSEINSAYVSSLISQGIINDTSKSMLEQIGEFYATNITLAQNLANSVLANLNTTQNIGIWYGNTLIASKNSTSIESAKNIDVATQIISGIQQGQGVTGFSARAYLSKSLQSKYFYFGGYIGDGNITAPVNYTGNISSVEMELAINNDFDLYVNDNLIGHYSKSPSDIMPSTYSIPTQYFNSGNNLVDLKSNSSLYIAGGFIKIDYQTDAVYDQPTIQYLPGVKGIINIYDGFYVPNTLESLNVFLHYNSSYQTQFTIGNVSVFTSNGSSGVTSQMLTDSYLSTILNYNSLSSNTNPFRLGIVNLSLVQGLNATADVILITDTSGSMAWRMDSDNSATIRNCTDSLINDPSTARISVAKCIDKTFIGTILNTTGNRVGLVSFSASVNNYVNLTSNQTLLNSTIDNYVASGSTCLSCAINQAYTILQNFGVPGRNKYIIVMTDGVANVRSTAACYNTNAIESRNSTTFQVDDGGSIVQYSGLWNLSNSPTLSNLNGVDILNNTFGFAVGDSYQIFRYNNSAWSLQQDLGNQNLYGVNVYNNTLAFAVGASGKIAKWSGSTWTEDTDIGNTNMRGVKVLNNTFAFAVGDSGTIYKWNGATWASYASVGNYDLYSIDIYNKTFAFAVGASGKIFSWNGNSWSQYADLGNMILTDVQIYNSTLAFATGDNDQIYKWTGSSWTSDYTGTASLNTIKIINSTLGFALGLSAGGVAQWSGSSWLTTYPPYLASGTLTTGIDCGDNDVCTLTSSIPSLNANYSACRANADLGATVHSVGFGPVASCSFAAQTLQSVANCGNGTYYASNNATALQQFYQTIANSIVSLSYKEQTSQTSGNITTQLYPDSYIQFQYQKANIPAGQIISLQNQFYNNYSGNFTVPSSAQLISVNAVSYSGPRWTYSGIINNNSFYNLSKYNSAFVNLGDPYSISIPTNLVSQNNTINTVTITTGVSNQNTSAGSLYNKIIYLLLENASSFSGISSTANGCLWQMYFEDGTNASIAIPSTYSGPNACVYSPLLQQYNTNDAFQSAAYNLLVLLDLNKNGKIDTNLQANSFQISASEVKGIPFSWSTQVQVRIWS